MNVSIDATEEFENILHTEKARKMAKKWLIGKVKGAVLGDLFKETDKSSNTNQEDVQGASSMNTAITIAFLIAAAALAWNFYK